jgi:hypothetical protein
MRSQAPEGGFFISSQATKISHPPATGSLGGGWALPVTFKTIRIYISRHPQPPAKYIRLNGISQSLYTRRVKINMLTASCIWDIVGGCLLNWRLQNYSLLSKHRKKRLIILTCISRKKKDYFGWDLCLVVIIQPTKSMKILF